MRETDAHARVRREVRVRFYAELNDFLPQERRQRAIGYAFEGTPSVKDTIEAIGVRRVDNPGQSQQGLVGQIVFLNQYIKGALIVAVVERGFELMRGAMQTRKAAAPDDPLSQFAAAGTAYIEFALEYPAYYRVMYSGDLLFNAGQEALQHTSAATFQELVADVEAAANYYRDTLGFRYERFWGEPPAFCILWRDNHGRVRAGEEPSTSTAAAASAPTASAPSIPTMR